MSSEILLHYEEITDQLDLDGFLAYKQEYKNRYNLIDIEVASKTNEILKSFYRDQILRKTLVTVKDRSSDLYGSLGAISSFEDDEMVLTFGNGPFLRFHHNELRFMLKKEIGSAFGIEVQTHIVAQSVERGRLIAYLPYDVQKPPYGVYIVKFGENERQINDEGPLTDMSLHLPLASSRA